MSVRFRICKGVTFGSSGFRFGGRIFGKYGPYISVGASGVLGRYGPVRVWQGAGYQRRPQSLIKSVKKQTPAQMAYFLAARERGMKKGIYRGK